MFYDLFSAVKTFKKFGLEFLHLLQFIQTSFFVYRKLRCSKKATKPRCGGENPYSIIAAVLTGPWMKTVRKRLVRSPQSDKDSINYPRINVILIVVGREDPNSPACCGIKFVHLQT